MDPALIVFGFGVGVLVGVWLGAHWSTTLPADVLRPALAVVLIASGLALLSKAGLSMPLGVLIGVPIGLGLLVYLVNRSRTRNPVEAPIR